ncbi:MAG: DUF222 domain-containing protein [Propionibacteriales bacterium]|nr:DUF222 domain-containing protein [Propionibacteriales bacterium]
MGQPLRCPTVGVDERVVPPPTGRRPRASGGGGGPVADVDRAAARAGPIKVPAGQPATSGRGVAYAVTADLGVVGGGADRRIHRGDHHQRLDKLVDDTLIRVVEVKLVEKLGTDGEDAVVVAPPAQVGRWARVLVAETEPDQQEERFQKGFADRAVHVFSGEDGLADLVVHHSSAELEALSHRLSLIARHGGADDPRSMNQRRADIAVDLLLGRADCTVPTSGLEAGDVHPADLEPDPVLSGGVRAQINVTVPIQTLIGVSDHPGELLNGEPVPASLIRKIAADPSSTWYRLLTDPAGNLIDLSTRSYKPTLPLGRALVARDRTCPAPGRTTSALVGETDHTIRYSLGGPTSYANTGRPCQSHHKAKESPGFTLSQPHREPSCGPIRVDTSTPAGRIRIRSPTGQTTGRNRCRRRRCRTPCGCTI